MPPNATTLKPLERRKECRSERGIRIFKRAPDGTRWQLRKLGDKWEALLRLPPGAASVKVQTWVPFRSDPALLKELLAAP